jgi:formylglycine-generating enzyme required for sulfatase activity
MPVDQRIVDLLQRYEEMVKAGRSVNAEMLCADCPELLPELRRWLKDLAALKSVLGETDIQELPGADGPPREVSTRILQIVKRFEEAWRRGRPPDLNEFLPSDTTARRAGLAALIHVDLERRLLVGEAARVETYLRHYPELADDVAAVLHLVAAEYEVRRRLEPGLGLDEYLRRFPAYEEALRLRLQGRLPRFKPGERPLASVDLELVELIGMGGFGEVWKARNPHFDGVEPVVLKFCIDPTAKDRLLRHEAGVLNQVMRQGRHPGIVSLLRTYLTADPPCLEYEYVEGGDLTSLMRRWQRQEEALTPALALRIILRLAKVMAFAHRLDPPIVHRDLKPANILVHRSDDKRIMFRITDFGIGGLAATRAIERLSELAADLPRVTMSTLRGAFTPLYASPQQMWGDPPDPRDDVYSLGVIWYQLLVSDLSAGRPAGNDWAAELRGLGFGADAAALLGSCMEFRAEDRPADAAVLAERLTALLPTSGVAGLRRQAQGDDLARQVQRTLDQAARSQERALELAMRHHDYAAAAQLLEAVPTHLRDATLYQKVCERRDQVARLDREVAEAVQGGHYEGVPAKVEELLKLQPHRDDLKRLLDALPKKPSLPAQQVVNSLGIKFKFIPAGDFLMGAPEAEAGHSPQERPQHPVTLTKPYYMSIYPVTQQQYVAVMGSNPAKFRSPDGEPLDRPVESVSWEQAVEFCRRLSEDFAEAEAGRVYRLPTEAEWERACRARTTTPFATGPSLSAHDANFNGSYPYGEAPPGPYLQETTPVGRYAANAFGLYAMHGNVWEWCLDCYHNHYYVSSPRKDPLGPAQGKTRVVRGGSWHSTALQCRSAARNSATQDSRDPQIGFRIVLLTGFRKP